MADIVAKVENRATRKISRKLIFGLLRRCVAFQGRHGGPWSILDETMWSLTPPLAKRISGAKKFRLSPQRDFCNNICQKQTSKASEFQTCGLTGSTNKRTRKVNRKGHLLRRFSSASTSSKTLIASELTCLVRSTSTRKPSRSCNTTLPSSTSAW